MRKGQMVFTAILLLAAAFVQFPKCLRAALTPWLGPLGCIRHRLRLSQDVMITTLRRRAICI
jgi:hypothetical protein